jgi:hypothetical protein
MSRRDGARVTCTVGQGGCITRNELNPAFNEHSNMSHLTGMGSGKRLDARDPPKSRLFNRLVQQHAVQGQ